mmetsp:Transcript_29839/g.75528  ORF Transcript_29839/g.75528 Transcript_29839/m.75528 type:complete len:450 (+) Transcript_29839:2418-3767(+)
MASEAPRGRFWRAMSCLNTFLPTEDSRRLARLPPLRSFLTIHTLRCLQVPPLLTSFMALLRPILRTMKRARVLPIRFPRSFLSWVTVDLPRAMVRSFCRFEPILRTNRCATYRQFQPLLTSLNADLRPMMLTMRLARFLPICSPLRRCRRVSNFCPMLARSLVVRLLEMCLTIREWRPRQCLPLRTSLLALLQPSLEMRYLAYTPSESPRLSLSLLTFLRPITLIMAFSCRRCTFFTILRASHFQVRRFPCLLLRRLVFRRVSRITFLRPSLKVSRFASLLPRRLPLRFCSRAHNPGPMRPCSCFTRRLVVLSRTIRRFSHFQRRPRLTSLLVGCLPMVRTSMRARCVPSTLSCRFMSFATTGFPRDCSRRLTRLLPTTRRRTTHRFRWRHRPPCCTRRFDSCRVIIVCRRLARFLPSRLPCLFLSSATTGAVICAKSFFSLRGVTTFT